MLRAGHANKSDVPGAILQRNKATSFAGFGWCTGRRLATNSNSSRAHDAGLFQARPSPSPSGLIRSGSCGPKVVNPRNVAARVAPT